MPLIIVLLLDRFGQSNQFGKKSKRKFRSMKQTTPRNIYKTSFEGPPGDVLRTFSKRRLW